MVHRANAAPRSSWDIASCIESSGRNFAVVTRGLSLVCLTYTANATMQSYKPFANIEQVIRAIVLSIVIRVLISCARDKTIPRAGRRNLRANETICGRTHILSASAAIILSSSICRTRIQEVHFRRHWQARFSICCRRRGHFTSQETTVTHCSAEAYIEQKPSREMQNAARREGRGTEQRGCSPLSRISRNPRNGESMVHGRVARDIGSGIVVAQKLHYVLIHLTIWRHFEPFDSLIVEIVSLFPFL